MAKSEVKEVVLSSERKETTIQEDADEYVSEFAKETRGKKKDWKNEK
jgi:hypothetical protein